MAIQVRERAAQRLLELAWPAAYKIGKLIDNRNPAIALAAARDVLDRNGFKTVERVQTDGRMVIEIELVDRSRTDAENAANPAGGRAHASAHARALDAPSAEKPAPNGTGHANGRVVEGG